MTGGRDRMLAGVNHLGRAHPDEQRMRALLFIMHLIILRRDPFSFIAGGEQTEFDVCVCVFVFIACVDVVACKLVALLMDALSHSRDSSW
jgi:hypothetical protein